MMLAVSIMDAVLTSSLPEKYGYSFNRSLDVVHKLFYIGICHFAPINVEYQCSRLQMLISNPPICALISDSIAPRCTSHTNRLSSISSQIQPTNDYILEV